MSGRRNNLDTERNLTFDALRICAMIMVTLLHITGHGLANADIVTLSGTYWIVLILNTFILVAVNCFVLITGYFLSSGTMKTQKLIMLWLQVWMYSVGVYLTLCMLPSTGVEFGFKTLIRCGLPILSNQYWFFTCYALLYLISPLLNILIQAVDKAKYQKMLGLLLVLFCAIPSVNIFGDGFGENAGYSLTWFIVLYLVAGYIRRYPISIRIKPMLVYSGSCLILCAIRLIGDVTDSIVQTAAYLQMNYNGPLVFLASVSLLLHCIASNGNFRKPMGSVVKTISPLVFGVYLLHDHRIISDIIWNDLVKLPEVANQPISLIIRITVTLVALFVCGIAVEFARSSVVNGIGKLVKRIIKR